MDSSFQWIALSMKLLLKVYGEEISSSLQAHISSVVCYASLSPSVPQLDKPVTVQLVHCAHLTSQSQSQYLSFVVAQVQPGKQSGPFNFELVPGGSFSPDSQIGSIELRSFSPVAVVIAKVKVALRAFTRARSNNVDFVQLLLMFSLTVPPMNCLALVYKKCSLDKVMMSLAAIQDMSHLKVYIECLTFIITFLVVNRGG